MFGYVRPVMDKLDQEDAMRFQSAYCGLCYELGVRYGVLARLILNYDFTFLAILLLDEEGACAGFRCPAKRFCKKERLVSSKALEIAADESVVLFYWKLQDEIADSGPFRGLRYRALRLLATPGYRKAEKRCFPFAQQVRENLALLRQMEADKVASIDRTADAFAKLLASAVWFIEEERRKQIYQQMLYHLGRWIYLIDALDDLPEDAQKNRYNPLIYRYGAENGVLDEDSRQRLVATLDHSVNLISSAFALEEWGQWLGVLENIIYYGLPSAGRLVLEGKWHAQVKTVRCCAGDRPAPADESERMELNS